MSSRNLKKAMSPSVLSLQQSLSQLRSLSSPVFSGISVGISKASVYGLLSVDGLIAISVAIIQLVLGILLAIGAIYLALNILDKLTTGVQEFEELKKGNVAVALEMAGVIIAVALIIQSGIVGITAALA